MSLEPLFPSAGTWRREHSGGYARALTTGFAELDDLLPAGGWPQAALTEILLADRGIGALRLLMPLLTALSHEDRWICWVAPPQRPCSPALAAAGVDLSRVLMVSPGPRQDGLWVVEQALRSGRCAAVLAWPAIDDGVALRRLQLAAQAGDAMGFLFRSQQVAARPSPAALRILLDTHSDGNLSVSLPRRRGGRGSGSVHLDTGLPHNVLARHARHAGSGSLARNWQ